MVEDKKKNMPETPDKVEVDTDFMKEKIKQRPINKKKIVRTTLGTAGLAVLFGGVACIVFLVLEPVFSKMINPENAVQEVTFTEDMQTEEISPEELIEDDSELASNAASEAANQAAAKAAEEAAKAAEAAVSAGSGQVAESVESVLANRSVTASDYQKIYTMLDDVATSASRSIVVVTGITSDYNWFNEAYESSDKTSGVIVADNGEQLLILTPSEDILNAEKIRITFPDSSQSDAEIKAYDKISGYTIVAVRDEDISVSTRSTLEIAELGSSKQNKLTGTPVIALGSPTGSTGSVAYGIVTGTSQTIDVVDTTAKLITTDMYGSKDANGVLINLSGQVIGILDMSYNTGDMRNMISAIGITDMKPLIEKLSNGGKKPYFGVYGSDVPADISESLGIPKGTYVRKVEMDSPAMDAGLMSGDVIMKCDGAEISSYADLQNALYEHDPADIITIGFVRENGSTYEEMETTVTLREEP